MFLFWASISQSFILTKEPAFTVLEDGAARSKSEESAVPLLDLQSTPPETPRPWIHQLSCTSATAILVQISSPLSSLPSVLSHQVSSAWVHLMLNCLQLHCQKPFCLRIKSPKEQFISNEVFLNVFRSIWPSYYLLPFFFSF